MPPTSRQRDTSLVARHKESAILSGGSAFDWRRIFACGDGSTEEHEHATLEIRVRLPVTALRISLRSTEGGRAS